VANRSFAEILGRTSTLFGIAFTSSSRPAAPKRQSLAAGISPHPVWTTADFSRAEKARRASYFDCWVFKGTRRVSTLRDQRLGTRPSPLNIQAETSLQTVLRIPTRGIFAPRRMAGARCQSRMVRPCSVRVEESCSENFSKVYADPYRAKRSSRTQSRG